MRKIVTIDGNYQNPIVSKTFFDVAIREVKLFKTLFDKKGDEIFQSNDPFRLLPDSATPHSEVFRITNDKRKEDALKEGDKKFRALAESTSFPILIFQDDYWVYVNAAGRKAFGYTTSELYMMHFWTFFGDSFNSDLVQKGKSRQNSKQPDCSYEFLIWCKSGSYKSMFLTVSSIIYNGKPAGIISMRDITEYKRTQELRKVIYAISNAVITTLDTEALILTIKKQLSLIIDTTHLAIVCYDSEYSLLSSPCKVDENEFVATWPNDKSLTGYMIKQNHPVLLSKDQIVRLVKAGAIDVDVTACQSWLGIPLHIGDKIIGAMYVQSHNQAMAYTDDDLEMMVFIAGHISNSIQHDRDKEDYRKALLKAEESENLKVAFLSNISHEIRTPMNAIVGFSELIENEEISVHDREDFSSIIGKSAMRLLSTVNDIIDVSEIHCNQLEINKKWVSLNDMLDQLLVLFNNEKTIKGKSNLTILLEKGFDDHQSMMCTDGLRIRQIFYCLLSNALIYTNVGVVKFGYAMRNGALCFYVEDTGKGIAKEKQEMIFQSFRQEDETQTRAYDGIGLGLTISKGLVGLLGGQIWIDSKEGEGSVFSFSIPFETLKCKYPHCTGTLCEHPNMKNTLQQL